MVRLCRMIKMMNIQQFLLSLDVYRVVSEVSLEVDDHVL